MHLPSFSVDVTILLFMAGALAYGVLFGQAKVKTLALSAYVGLVLAQNFGIGLHDFALHSWSLDATRLIVFIAPLVLLELGRFQHGLEGRHRGALLPTLILAVLTAALIITASLSLLQPASLQGVLDNSNLASQLYNLRLWWLGLVPVAVIITSFFKLGGRSSRH